MKEFTFVITDSVGIHARPAGLLVKKAGEFQSSVTIQKDGKKADAKRLFSLMSLSAKQKDTITVTIEGEDEEAAAAAIQSFLKENL